MQSINPAFKIIGHRGAAGLVTENTLASIQKAIDLRVDCIEIDVWKTTDNEIIVFHDASLDRLTFECGFVAEMDYSTLREIRLKSGEQIPALQEVVELVKRNKTLLLVEVKTENAFLETLQILKKNLSYSEFIIGSFYHQQIMELKQNKPELQTAIMFEGVPADLAEYLEKVNPNYVVAAIETHNETLINTVKMQGRKLLFYTVNTPPQIEQALRASPYGIITNFPDRFMKQAN